MKAGSKQYLFWWLNTKSLWGGSGREHAGGLQRSGSTKNQGWLNLILSVWLCGNGCCSMAHILCVEIYIWLGFFCFLIYIYFDWEFTDLILHGVHGPEMSWNVLEFRQCPGMSWIFLFFLEIVLNCPEILLFTYF